MSAVLATGMVAASGVHLALGCGSLSARTVPRLLAEIAMLAAMIDACVLGAGLLSPRAWVGLLLVLAAVVLGWPDRDTRDHWHACALVLAAGLLSLPHHHGAGTAAPAFSYVVTCGVAVYVAYATLLALRADRGRLGPRDGRGRSQVAASAIGLLCMTALMST